MANELNPEVLHRLARLGAQARLDQIESERVAILDTFPDLRLRPARTAKRTATRRRRAAKAEATAKTAPARRRKMSAAERKAVSERMRKYWADRRKAKGK